MIGQLEAPPLTPQAITLENVIRWLVIPWLVITALDRLGVIRKVSWSEAFAPMRSPRRKHR